LLRNLTPEEKQIKIRTELENSQKQLPVFKKVLDFKIWDRELPKTSTKKIKRNKLEVEINSKTKDAKTNESEDFLFNEQEAHIASLIGKFLKESNLEINYHTNLQNDLGIDSIMKIELISEIEKDLDISIPEEIIYTIESFPDLIQTINTFSEKSELEDAHHEQDEIIKEPGRITKIISSSLIFGFLKLLFKIELINGNRIPATDTFIIAANHASMLDLPVVSAILAKKVRKQISARQHTIISTKSH